MMRTSGRFSDVGLEELFAEGPSGTVGDMLFGHRRVTLRDRSASVICRQSSFGSAQPTIADT